MGNSTVKAIQAGMRDGQVRAMEQWPYPPRLAEKYANEVQVTRTEHDATLRFYRKTAKRDGSCSTGALVSEITVPLGVLDAMLAEAKSDGE